MSFLFSQRFMKFFSSSFALAVFPWFLPSHFVSSFFCNFLNHVYHVFYSIPFAALHFRSWLYPELNWATVPSSVETKCSAGCCQPPPPPLVPIVYAPQWFTGLLPTHFRDPGPRPGSLAGSDVGEEPSPGLESSLGVVHSLWPKVRFLSQTGGQGEPTTFLRPQLSLLSDCHGPEELSPAHGRVHSLPHVDQRSTVSRRVPSLRPLLGVLPQPSLRPLRLPGVLISELGRNTKHGKKNMD